MSITVVGSVITRRGTDVSKAAPITYFDNVVLPNYNTFQDVDQAMKDMSLLTQVFTDPLTSNTVKNALRERLISFTLQVITDGQIYIDSTSTGPFFADNVLRLANTTTGLGTTSRQNLFKAMLALITKVNENSAASNTCFDSISTTKFLTALSLLLNSVNTTTFDPVIGGDFSTFISTVQNCFQRTLVCNQSPISITSSSLVASFGISAIYPNTSQRLCGVTVPDLSDALSVADDAGCIKYSCGIYTKSKTLVSSIGNLLDMSDTIVELSFKGADDQIWSLNYTNSSSSSNAAISIPIPLATNFLQQNNLTSFNISSQSNDTNRPTCTFIESLNSTTSPDWSEDGCELVTLNATYAVCSCTHLTAFAIGVKQAQVPIILNATSTTSNSIPASVSPTTEANQPSNTTPSAVPNPGSLDGSQPAALNLYVVIGGSVGGILLLVGLAALAWIIYKKNKTNVVGGLSNIPALEDHPELEDSLEQTIEDDSSDTVDYHAIQIQGKEQKPLIDDSASKSDAESKASDLSVDSLAMLQAHSSREDLKQSPSTIAAPIQIEPSDSSEPTSVSETNSEMKFTTLPGSIDDSVEGKSPDELKNLAGSPQSPLLIQSPQSPISPLSPQSPQSPPLNIGSMESIAESPSTSSPTNNKWWSSQNSGNRDGQQRKVYPEMHKPKRKAGSAMPNTWPMDI
jgi:hypothetical protein